MGALLRTLDWHGAQMKVLRSRSPSLVGTEGTVIAETRRTLMIATAARRVVTVPKPGVTLRVSLPTPETGVPTPTQVLLQGDSLLR